MPGKVRLPATERLHHNGRMPPATPFDGQSQESRRQGRLERPREGRWLAGVCVALARYSGRRVGTTRLAFVLTVPFFGLPIVAYLAWWLILPEEGGRERSRGSALFSGLASILLSFGGALALLTLAAASAVATIFGLGWGVVIVAAGVLAIGVFWMREVNPGWMLLPLAALVVPAAVIVGLNAHLDRQFGQVSVAPESRGELGSGEYGIGVGTLFVDLRHYDWAAGAPAPLKISGGVGRTIVALPTHRCVAVHIDYKTHDGVLHGIADALGAEGTETPGLTVFGRIFAGGQGVVAPSAPKGAPKLSVDFTSQGGELIVRDYPNSIDPRGWSSWPGEPYYGVAQSTGLSKADIRRQQKLNRQIRDELPGPCANGGHR
jgi:phage shock protein PspC (stress-responsive transcriptional regulator)